MNSFHADHTSCRAQKASETRFVVIGFLFIITVLPLPAIADVPVIQRTKPYGVATYTAMLPGTWARFPHTGGGHIAYGYAVGTMSQIICTFWSEDRRTPLPFTKAAGWEIVLKEHLLKEVRNNPSKMFQYLRQRRSNVSVEDHSITASDAQVTMTIVYSYDDKSLVLGQDFMIRGIASEATVFSPYAAIRSVCVTPNASYSANQADLLRRVIDSIVVNVAK